MQNCFRAFNIDQESFHQINKSIVLAWTDVCFSKDFCGDSMIPKSCAESFEITIDQQNEEAVWFSSGSSKISEGIRTFLKKVSSGDKIYLTKLL